MRQWALIAIRNSSKSKVDSQHQKKLLIALIYPLHVAIVGPHCKRRCTCESDGQNDAN